MNVRSDLQLDMCDLQTDFFHSERSEKGYDFIYYKKKLCLKRK